MIKQYDVRGRNRKQMLEDYGLSHTLRSVGDYNWLQDKDIDVLAISWGKERINGAIIHVEGYGNYSVIGYRPILEYVLEVLRND